jgi:putative transposase
MTESFCGTLQLEVLDRHSWNLRAELANAIFEWIVLVQPTRRHSSIRMLSPVDFEQLHAPPVFSLLPYSRHLVSSAGPET